MHFILFSIFSEINYSFSIFFPAFYFHRRVRLFTSSAPKLAPHYSAKHYPVRLEPMAGTGLLFLFAHSLRVCVCFWTLPHHFSSTTTSSGICLNSHTHTSTNMKTVTTERSHHSVPSEACNAASVFRWRPSIYHTGTVCDSSSRCKSIHPYRECDSEPEWVSVRVWWKELHGGSISASQDTHTLSPSINNTGDNCVSILNRSLLLA